MPSQAEITAGLFRNIEDHFRKASSNQPVLAREFVLGGQNIRLEFAGPALVDRIYPALSHHLNSHTDEHASNDLTIGIWDAASTGTGAPEMPWSHDQFVSRRDIAGANCDEYRVTYDLFCGVISIVSLKEGRAYWWISESAKLPLYESAAPLREVLQTWFDHLEATFVHAAAIGNDQGALLLVGSGGSGKSTTALASASSDLRLLGEDYCLLTNFEGTEPTVHSLYSSAKLTENSLNLLPHLRPLVINPDMAEEDGKAVLMLHPSMPVQRKSPVKAIIMPTQTGSGDTRLIPSSAKAALLALAPSTILQLSGMGQSAFRKMKHLAEQVPAYRLEIGESPQQAAEILSPLLADLS